MNGVMQYIGRAARCAAMFRDICLENEELRGPRSLYILKICDNPGISQDLLVRGIYANKSNVTRQLAALEEAGYITRCSDEYDRRIMRAFPTEKAAAVYPKIQRVYHEWDTAMLEGLSEDEQEQLLSMLHRITERAAAIAEHERKGRYGI